MLKLAGNVERVLRAALGLVLLSMIFFLEGEGRWFGLVGLFPLITAIAGTCPAGLLFGNASCSLDIPERTDMKQVNEKLWISGQPGNADLQAVRARGVTMIINNRPDGEDFGQPPVSQQRAIASSLGMSYAHLPVHPGGFDRATVRAFQEALANAPGPVLAHCRSGMRSAMLWAIGEVMDGRMQPRELDAVGRRIGIDLSGARNWLLVNA